MSNLDEYIKIQEKQLESIFLEYGMPEQYYFYNLEDIELNTRTIKSNTLIKKDEYLGRWNELINDGYSWINIAPMGYWKNGFVFCIEYHQGQKKRVPVGRTAVMLPGIPIDINGRIKIQFNENVKVIE